MCEIKLKSDTPPEVREKIRKLEDECDKLEDWGYRIVYAIEFLIIVLLAICI